MNKLGFAITVLVLALWCGPPVAAAGEKPSMTERLAASDNAFGADLFAYLVQAQPETTVLVSPLSVATVLEMLGQGAGDKTQQAFNDALHLKDQALTLSDAAKSQQKLRQVMEPGKGVTFEIANGIWIDRRFPLNQAYADAQRRLFASEIRSVDFGLPHALDEINNWVSKRTNRKIPQVLSSLPPQSSMVLVNALHFVGRWQKPFDASRTSPGPFTEADNAKLTVPMMRRDGIMKYLETAEFQAVALPFADTKYEIVIAIPKPGHERAAITSFAQHWASILGDSQFSNQEGNLALPRFKLSWSGNVKPALAAAKLAPAFGSQADYTGLSSKQISIGMVVHDVFLEADEQGAEAAAATAVTMIGAALRPVPIRRFAMTVDRPFFVLLREVNTGALLVFGYVADPGTNSKAPAH